MDELNKNEEISNKLYSLVEKNLAKSGQTMPFSKEVFSFFERQKTDYLDCFEISDLDNQYFFQIAYIGIYKKLPPQSLEEKWRPFYSLPKREFQYRVFDLLLTRRERKMADGIMTNIFYDL